MAGVSEDREVAVPEAGRRKGPARVVRASLGALSGLITGLAALCVAELVAPSVRPEASPVTAVGGAVIDRTPPWLKDFAVRHFGTNDKLVLQLGILALLAAFAMAVGVAALRYRKTGSAAVLLFGAVGAVGAVAAAGRPDAGPLDALPSVVGGALGCGVLYLLTGRLALRPFRTVGVTEGKGETHGVFDRRGFVIAATAAVAASAGAGVLGRRLNASGAAQAAAARKNIVFPRPASYARPIPAGADLRLQGLSPFSRRCCLRSGGPLPASSPLAAPG